MTAYFYLYWNNLTILCDTHYCVIFQNVGVARSWIVHLTQIFKRL